ncbi:MAG: hypothetical protein HOC09_07005 [Deltaproteobacteria bacterium]|nr:hypothetical protein [Deltaproteobacteria bacterium]
MDDHNKRILKILGNDCERNIKNALKYLEYLNNSIKYPCSLTGMEDFPWEERYILGGWDKNEYEKLKKIKASYTDDFELIEFKEPIPGTDELIAKVRRKSDKKIFEIGLSWLETTDIENHNCNYSVLI